MPLSTVGQRTWKLQSYAIVFSTFSFMQSPSGYLFIIMSIIIFLDSGRQRKKCFIMKLTYEDKVRIYELKKQGESFRKLSNQFGINISNLQYMIKLIDRYGIEIIKKGKNCYYSHELKQEIIDKVLLEGCSQQSVCLDYGLSNQGLLNNWIAQYKKNG